MVQHARFSGSASWAPQHPHASPSPQKSKGKPMRQFYQDGMRPQSSSQQLRGSSSDSEKFWEGSVLPPCAYVSGDHGAPSIHVRFRPGVLSMEAPAARTLSATLLLDFTRPSTDFWIASSLPRTNLRSLWLTHLVDSTSAFLPVFVHEPLRHG